MILGLEIGMIIFGLIALIRGKLTISKTKVVEGLPARLLGLLALTPLPIVFVVGIGFVLASNPADPEKFAEENKMTLVGIEAGIVIFIAILVFGLGAAMGTNPTEARKKKRRRDEDDEYDDYEDAPPRRKARRDEEEDEYEEDDRPRRRPRRYEDDEDEDEDDRDADRRRRYR